MNPGQRLVKMDILVPRSVQCNVDTPCPHAHVKKLIDPHFWMVYKTSKYFCRKPKVTHEGIETSKLHPPGLVIFIVIQRPLGEQDLLAVLPISDEHPVKGLSAYLQHKI